MRTLPLLLAAALSASPAFATEPDPVAAVEPAFRACLTGLRAEAPGKGVRAATFDAHLKDIAPDLSVIELLNAQPEFVAPVWDYIDGLVDAERIADGRAMLDEHAGTLASIEAQYGVDAATVVAVWGVESNYGKLFGRRPVLRSLATLACIDRRQAFFRGELFAALQIVQDGHIAVDDFTGSWAGAFGHTQFMPSTFQRIAVDFDGDGRRDLIGSIPDALASTANYLARSQWRSGQPWGFEVKLPAGFDASGTGRRNKQPMREWARRGLTRVDGSALPAGDTAAGLLLPAGVEGPAFLTLRNFDAIHSYNASERYALAIAHLSDRLRGGEAFVTPWPGGEGGLSRIERREVQLMLLARGHDIGAIDGILGPRSREAIRAEQARLGMAEDGRAGQVFLRALRASFREGTPEAAANEADAAGTVDEGND